MGNKKIWEEWEKWENLGKMGKFEKNGKIWEIQEKWAIPGKYREKITEKFPVGSLSQRVGNPSAATICSGFYVSKMDEDKNGTQISPHRT